MRKVLSITVSIASAVVLSGCASTNPTPTAPNSASTTPRSPIYKTNNSTTTKPSNSVTRPKVVNFNGFVASSNHGHPSPDVSKFLSQISANMMQSANKEIGVRPGAKIEPRFSGFSRNMVLKYDGVLFEFTPAEVYWANPSNTGNGTEWVYLVSAVPPSGFHFTQQHLATDMVDALSNAMLGLGLGAQSFEENPSFQSQFTNTPHKLPAYFGVTRFDFQTLLGSKISLLTKAYNAQWVLNKQTIGGNLNGAMTLNKNAFDQWMNALLFHS